MNEKLNWTEKGLDVAIHGSVEFNNEVHYHTRYSTTQVNIHYLQRFENWLDAPPGRSSHVDDDGESESSRSFRRNPG